MRSVAIILALFLSACAADGIAGNLAHQYLMPNASKLPRGDIDEITRLVSEKSGQPILGIALQRKGRRAGEVTVVTAYRVETTGRSWCILASEGSGSLATSPKEVLVLSLESLIGLALSED